MSVAKQINSTAVGAEDGLAQRFAIRRIRNWCSFQGYKNKPSVSCPPAGGFVSFLGNAKKKGISN